MVMVFSKIKLFLLIFIFIARPILIKTCFEFSCEECESEEFGKCTKCKENFELVDGTCPCKDSSCVLCDKGIENASCFLCKNSYDRSNNKCYFKCKYDNCIECREDRCIRCRDNYYFDKKCIRDYSPPFINYCYDKFCADCSPDPNECDECFEHYTLVKNRCELDPKYIPCEGIECYTKLGTGFHYCENKCLFCLSDKIYAKYNCENKDLCKIENCLICRNQTECFQCKPGYYPESGQCKEKCIEGCYMCSTYDKCDYCRIGFTKNSNGQCILDSNKLNFNVSLYNYKKKLLIEYSNNIKNNDISKNKEILEKLNDNNCTTFNDGESICKACKYPYDVKNNKCVYICKNEHCLDCTFYYDDNNFSYKENCTKCKDYYNLINGTCFFNGTCYDKNCEKCSSEGKTDCLKCKEDKGLSGGLCYETNCYDKNCELCHNKEEDSSCVRCKEGKQLHGGFCKDPSFISNDNYNNNKESDNINNIDESCKKHISN